MVRSCRLLPLPVSILIVVLVGAPTSLAQKPGPSYRDIAMGHLSSGNLDSARVFYQKWLEADPGDEVSWYNLACVESLSGNVEAGIRAFEMAVAAGWDDIDHSRTDADLDSIRADPRFEAAIEKMRVEKAGDGPADYHRHFLTRRSVGTYIVLLPPDYDSSGKFYPLCLILHGSGSTELGHGKIADKIGREGVIYVVPRAPFPHAGVAQASGELGYTAWPPEQPDSTDALRDSLPTQYIDWIMECAADARQRYRIDDSKAIVLGHSQGAAFAWNTATQYPARIRSIFSYAGYYLDRFRTDLALDNIRRNGVDINLAHGMKDQTVDISESKTLDSTLTAHHITHSFMQASGAGHFISDRVFRAMTTWIDRFRLPVDDSD
jgi:predicted esterase